MSPRDLDNHITGHYGEDQFRRLPCDETPTCECDACFLRREQARARRGEWLVDIGAGVGFLAITWFLIFKAPGWLFQ